MHSPAEPGPNEAWLSSLSPWPERFGLERMQELLAELDHPERAFRSIHIVGTNGKTTTTKRIESLLVREGVRTGATISPHVLGWAERISIDGVPADLERALGRVRAPAERLGATQFEVITAAAFAELAAAGVEVAVVEAGLGGRHDATNVLGAEVVLLTNVALEHTQWLGSTREAIAGEKLAVIAPGAAVVLGEGEWESIAREAGAGSIAVVPQDELAPAAVELLLGRSISPEPVELRVPGRLEWKSERELWDGAHNPAGAAWLAERLPARRWTVVASILADKDVVSMLRTLATISDTLVATGSSSPRSLAASELAERAAGLFSRVEVLDDPGAALARGRKLAAPDGSVLVTGSLYFLADLASRKEAVS